MRPVLILQHLAGDGPAYLATWLARRGIPADVRCSERGEAFPADIGGYRALAVLGGAMSANDPLPGLRDAERLILQAMSADRPVIGHCLGGQLMARALGARIAASPAPEIGWLPVDWAAEAGAWFGPALADPEPPRVFHWHFEAFALPPQAQALGGSPACPHQAFAIGPHLAMQFHVELDEEKLHRWAREPEDSYAPAHAAHPATVQSADAMLADAARRLAAQQRLADAAYGRWIAAAG
ncbi:type 1 glutamine amidotransferase [Piscinibacter sakaiensis]|uniref:Glutamine amidotransferase, class-I n=1 Tax=Piscinibacter sakaiensis TaxID=1547922 RepID=A0A0K8NXP4_PISS1|nr:type 1 glutamine amidotransferase [Piscinibacter sakaiensis]GAP34695.1 glutamine amidotransferase, class-I [Piscinibacter sakaiensis]